MNKLRILCLHGFTSNGAVHARQLQRITSQLPEYEFLFPEGPHQVDIADQMDMTKPANQAWSEIVMSASVSGHRAWWYARDDDTQSETTKFVGLVESLDYLRAYVQERGPVHAIWGFSQGACFAGMLCALLQSKHATHPLRKHLEPPTDDSVSFGTPLAGTIFAGFRPHVPQFDVLYEPGIDVPTLHVIGEQDPLVRSGRSEALLRVCKNNERIVHPGGHDVPKKEADIARIVEFTRRHVRSSGESAEPPVAQASL
jgi:pimeloyl-ACP methyl ester carboxylesterase